MTNPAELAKLLYEAADHADEIAIEIAKIAGQEVPAGSLDAVYIREAAAMLDQIASTEAGIPVTEQKQHLGGSCPEIADNSTMSAKEVLVPRDLFTRLVDAAEEAAGGGYGGPSEQPWDDVDAAKALLVMPLK